MVGRAYRDVVVIFMNYGVTFFLFVFLLLLLLL